ncbi:hypothetical protein, partial [Pseudomonas savastanoi]
TRGGSLCVFTDLFGLVKVARCLNTFEYTGCCQSSGRAPQNNWKWHLNSLSMCGRIIDFVCMLRIHARFQIGRDIFAFAHMRRQVLLIEIIYPTN